MQNVIQLGLHIVLNYQWLSTMSIIKRYTHYIVLGWYYFGKVEGWGLVRNVLEMERYIVGWRGGGCVVFEMNTWWMRKRTLQPKENGDKKSGSWCVYVFGCLFFAS